MKQILAVFIPSAATPITLGCLGLMAVGVWYLIDGRAYRIGAHGLAFARHVDAHLAYGPWRA
jgi:hypothetical protein